MNNLPKLGKWNTAFHNVEAVFLRWWSSSCLDWPWHKVLSFYCFIDAFLISLHIIKELFHAYRAYIELWILAGSLESTREWYVRAARGRAETELQLLMCYPNFLSASTTKVAQLKSWTNSFTTKWPTCVWRNRFYVIVSGLPCNRDLPENKGWKARHKWTRNIW